MLRDRNLSLSCIIMFCAFGVVYCSCIALPSLLQSLFGYDALRSGMMMSPSGVSSMVAMIIAGALLGRQVDARWLVGSGLVVMAIASYARSQMNLEIGPWQVIWPHALVMLGIGFVFAPISVAAYKYIPVHLRGAAVGLLSLLRTEGGSVGTSAAKIIEDRRVPTAHFPHWRGLKPTEPRCAILSGAGPRLTYSQSSGDPVWSQQASLQSLDDMRQQQAAALSYFDVFFLCSVVSSALVVLIFFMKALRVRRKAERISAE